MKTKGLGIIIWLIASGIFMPGALRGQIWKPLGLGIPNAIPVATTSTNDNLYFAFVDSVTITKTKIVGVVRWNGLFWQDLSLFKAGSGSIVTSLAWHKNKLYIGGFFDTAYGISPKTGIMVLDGNTWSNAARRKADDQTPIRVNDLEIFNDTLYAAGNFNRLDTNRASSIARLDLATGNWAPLEMLQLNSAFNGQAFCMEVFNDTLFVGGNYMKVAGNKPSPIIKIKGKSTIGDTSSLFKSVAVMQAGGKNELMVFGVEDALKRAIYSYKNNNWIDRSKTFPNLQNATIIDAEYYGNEFWACGFIDLGSSKVNNIIKWNDDDYWQELDDINLQGTIFLESSRGRLFAAGKFLNYRKLQLNHVAEYDSTLVIITGRVFNDANGNCKKDISERFLPGQVVTALGGLNVAYTDKEGMYSFIGPKIGKYEVKPFFNKKYWTVASACTKAYTFDTNSGESVYDSADFAFQLNNSIEDVSVNILPNTGDKIRRGFTELYTLSFRNNGGKIVPQVIIKLKIPDSLKNFFSIPAPDSIRKNIAYYSTSNLEEGIEKSVVFTGKVNSSSTSQIGFSAEATGVNDAYTSDNYDTLGQQVEDTLNLNGKFIFPQPPQGDSITTFAIGGGRYDVEYLIRFENTTPDTINTVVLIDTIDLNLSIEFIQEMGASHPYTTQVINLPPQLGKAVLVWTFKDIKLPPNNTHSNDFTDNRGHLRFKLRLDNKTPVGTLVKNKADIVFDAGNPLATNYVYCTLDNSTAIQELNMAGNNVLLYPNPANSNLTIVLPEENTYTYSISDIQGRTCLPAQTFAGNATSLTISSLPQGIYFLRISSTGGVVYHKKFVKE